MHVALVCDKAEEICGRFCRQGDLRDSARDRRPPSAEALGYDMPVLRGLCLTLCRQERRSGIYSLEINFVPNSLRLIGKTVPAGTEYRSPAFQRWELVKLRPESWSPPSADEGTTCLPEHP